MEKVFLKNAGLTTLTAALLVVDCENEKIVFAHGTNIGYISPDKIFYVKQEYFKGGSKHTVFTQQFIEIIEKTYQLEGSITEERVVALQNSVKELGNINTTLNREKDPVKVKALVEHALSIVKEFSNVPNQKRFAEIEAKANAILNPVAPAVKPVAPAVKPVIIPPAPPLSAEEKLKAAKKNALLQFDILNVHMKKQKAKKAAKVFMNEAEKLKLTFETNFSKDPDIVKAFNAVKRTFSTK